MHTHANSADTTRGSQFVTGGIVALILAAGTAGVFMLHQSHARQLADLKNSHRSEQHQATLAVKANLERTLTTIHHGLRTIARMPGVRAMHGSELEPNARQAIQELYNNLGSEVAMSEVYVVPRDLDADAAEGSDAPKEPWITFDELIVSNKPVERAAPAEGAVAARAVVAEPAARRPEIIVKPAPVPLEPEQPAAKNEAPAPAESTIAPAAEPNSLVQMPEAPPAVKAVESEPPAKSAAPDVLVAHVQTSDPAAGTGAQLRLGKPEKKKLFSEPWATPQNQVSLPVQAHLGPPRPLATRPPSARVQVSRVSELVRTALEGATPSVPTVSHAAVAAAPVEDSRATVAAVEVVAAGSPSTADAAHGATHVANTAPAAEVSPVAPTATPALPVSEIPPPEAAVEVTSTALQTQVAAAEPPKVHVERAEPKVDVKPVAQTRSGGPEEVEIFEYRLMKKQLAWFGAHYPTQAQVNGLNFPVIGGEKVVTCDNSRYDAAKPKDEDRSGFVLSVPFYGEDGKLAGCVSGVVLAHAMRDLLPSGDFAILHTSTSTVLESHKPEQSRQSSAAIAQAQADSQLIYSEVAQVTFPDAAGNWLLWAGQSDAAFEARADVAGARSLYRIGTGAIGAVSLLLAGAAAFIRVRGQRMRRAIALQEARVGEVLRAVDAAAAGDLRVTLPVDGDDGVARLACGFGDLIQKFREMIQKMSTMSTQLMEVGGTLNENSELLSSASVDTDRLTQGAVANAGEIAGAVRELSKSLEVLHAGASGIAKAAAESAEISGRGAAAADQATSTVSALNTSSAEIANVLELIRDIADRTNLLALNAAIEAARAGEAGRGFAVVAGEVTKLASQTNEAVSNIESRIRTTRKDSELATTSVKGVREILQQIDGHQRSIGTAVSAQTSTSARMAAAATQASATMDRISSTLTTVADASQRNAAAAREVATATQAITDVSAGLSSLFQKFRT